jgi:hypothetical protein
MPELRSEHLQELFRFRPWPQGDPVAPWLIDTLDKGQLVRLAVAGLEFNRSVLEAQLKANAQAMEIIKGSK